MLLITILDALQISIYIFILIASFINELYLIATFTLLFLSLRVIYACCICINPVERTILIFTIIYFLFSLIIYLIEAVLIGIIQNEVFGIMLGAAFFFYLLEIVAYWRYLRQIAVPSNNEV